jgi:hypothetical protein
VNNELERIWKKRPWSNFKVLPWHSPERAENSHSPDRDFNPGLSKYEARVLNIRPRCLVRLMISQNNPVFVFAVH